MSSPSSLVLMTPETLNEVVALYVGKKRKRYIVHKKILCDQSEFFDAGFNNEFREATKREIYLLEDDPTALAALIEYMYRGSVRKFWPIAEPIFLASIT
ncbi:hypothetical protein EYC80_005551 [Monilinia laxa]|uniref:BTB domain-containing protein n=1 Tax=Monilinia laxa TaxID=61186 RepID=A0A5N6KE85_MONLA|nr:hypothetical protein EYC80_005551 [Monilinia laxa]